MEKKEAIEVLKIMQGGVKDKWSKALQTAISCLEQLGLWEDATDNLAKKLTKAEVENKTNIRP
jgi:hypothetical protein